MSDFIAVDVSGLTELQTVLPLLPDAVADDGVELADGLIIDIMRSYAQYSYVSRDEVPWVSVKQRKYVMMMIKQGLIKVPYTRTQELSNGWKTIGSGQSQLVVNETPYGGFVMGQGETGVQARRFHVMGWDTIQERISDRMDNILLRFAEGVNKALRRLNLG